MKFGSPLGEFLATALATAVHSGNDDKDSLFLSQYSVNDVWWTYEEMFCNLFLSSKRKKILPPKPHNPKTSNLSTLLHILVPFLLIGLPPR